MRIAIVNDLPLAREALRRVVLSHPDYTIAWVAENGAQAVQLAKQDRPDVILMDLVMPGMDGVEATRRIMAESPCPILVVTATVAGNYQLALEAMKYGGIDAVHTPELGLNGELRGSQELLARLERLERARRLSSDTGLIYRSPDFAEGSAPPLVALGASTGGPEAIAVILERLPAKFPFPVLVVQHISAEFVADLVTWLKRRSHLPVEPAVEGLVPTPGKVSIASSNDHLILTRERTFHYTREPVNEPFRPSVDVCFASLAAYWPTPGVAALLTGMWDDGARGLGKLREAGWLTIAQDEGSSVVYGMPRAAVERNAACRVLPIQHIASAILARLRV